MDTRSSRQHEHVDFYIPSEPVERGAGQRSDYGHNGDGGGFRVWA